MFGWLRRRAAARKRHRLVERRLQLLEAARDLQRAGDIEAYAAKTAEAEQAERDLEAFDRAAATGPVPPAPGS